MFKTITCNPLLATQGSHVCIAQESVDEKKQIVRRYVLLNSETLDATKYSSKEEFNAAIEREIEAFQKASKQGSSAADMLSEL